MKVSIENENNFIVFLNDKLFDFENKDDLEFYFKQLFIEIKDRYKIQVNGYYNINVYKDKIYGIILSMEKEEIEYFDYLDNQIEMRIIFSPYNKFVYKLEENNLNVPIAHCDVYSYLGNIYIMPNNDIKDIEFAQILEYTTVIYGEEADNIIKYSKKMR